MVPYGVGMTDTQPVTDDQLWAIPLEHRRTVARWLAERSHTFVGSWVLPEREALLIREALQGAAADLVTPGVDDSTTGHARAVLSELVADVAALRARQDLDDEHAAERLEREI
jgi:hypothetical protein